MACTVTLARARTVPTRLHERVCSGRAGIRGTRVNAPATDIGVSGSGETFDFMDGGEWRWFDLN